MTNKTLHVDKPIIISFLKMKCFKLNTLRKLAEHDENIR